MAFVNSIEIDTAYLPAININTAAPSGGSGFASWVLARIKPRIVLNTEIGVKTFAPWGDPGATAWPAVRDFLIVGIFVAFVLFVFTRKG